MDRLEIGGLKVTKKEMRSLEHGHSTTLPSELFVSPNSGRENELLFPPASCGGF
jgi:hypothetical protein